MTALLPITFQALLKNMFEYMDFPSPQSYIRVTRCSHLFFQGLNPHTQVGRHSAMIDEEMTLNVVHFCTCVSNTFGLKKLTGKAVR